MFWIKFKVATKAGHQRIDSSCFSNMSLPMQKKKKKRWLQIISFTGLLTSFKMTCYDCLLFKSKQLILFTFTDQYFPTIDCGKKTLSQCHPNILLKLLDQFPQNRTFLKHPIQCMLLLIKTAINFALFWQRRVIQSNNLSNKEEPEAIDVSAYSRFSRAIKTSDSSMTLPSD